MNSCFLEANQELIFDFEVCSQFWFFHSIPLNFRSGPQLLDIYLYKTEISIQEKGVFLWSQRRRYSNPLYPRFLALTIHH